jgi:hypothetical protein
MRLTSGSIKATGGVRSGGRDLVSGGAVVSARELAGVGAAMAAQFLCVEAE